MPELTIHLSVPVEPTPRVLQVAGMFDLAVPRASAEAWTVSLPLEGLPAWSIGLIVGPSGCGKSTIARRLWPEALARTESFSWPHVRAIIDAFPEGLSVKEVAELLSSVGFSSPPAWLRPFRVLSTGQQFRCTMARVLAEARAEPDTARGAPPVVVVDEFTSVVDRTVARVGSAAIARTVRARQLQFVAVTCHEDVEEWLQPDWVYRPATNGFARRSLQRRPPIALSIARCTREAWELFRRHHYLSHELGRGAVCYPASWEGRPVAFSAWLPFVGSGKGWREHRTVTLPDFQGIGIGNALSTFIASLWKAHGQAARSTTTHPAMIRSRCRSKLWKMTRPPALCTARERRLRGIKHATTRLTAGFKYVGPPLDRAIAARLYQPRMVI